jgi:hypothetical protein
MKAEIPVYIWPLMWSLYADAARPSLCLLKSWLFDPVIRDYMSSQNTSNVKTCLLVSVGTTEL